jgi:hypothetical protein
MLLDDVPQRAAEAMLFLQERPSGRRLLVQALACGGMAVKGVRAGHTSHTSHCASGELWGGRALVPDPWHGATSSEVQETGVVVSL